MSLPQRVGPFTLMRAVGQDGVTESFVAFLEEPAGRRVIAHRLTTVFASDEGRRQGLLARVDDLRAVRHPVLLPIIDVVEHGGSTYILQDWADVVSGDEIVRWCRENGRQIPFNVYLNLATQACNGLEALHSRPGSATGSDHVLHLGVRPSAIHITRDGKVVIGGYAFTRSPTTVPQALGAANTAPRMEYLSPEQTTPDEVLTPASDIFSLGSTLYELLTTDAMFRAGSNLQTIHNVRRAEVSQYLLRAKDLLPGLDKVLYRALSLNPRHRYQRAFVLREDLRGLMSGFSFSRISDETREFLGPVFARSASTPQLATTADMSDSTDALIAAAITSSPPAKKTGFQRRREARRRAAEPPKPVLLDELVSKPAPDRPRANRPTLEPMEGDFGVTDASLPDDAPAQTVDPPTDDRIPPTTGASDAEAPARRNTLAPVDDMDDILSPAGTPVPAHDTAPFERRSTPRDGEQTTLAFLRSDGDDEPEPIDEDTLGRDGTSGENTEWFNREGAATQPADQPEPAPPESKKLDEDFFAVGADASDTTAVSRTKPPPELEPAPTMKRRGIAAMAPAPGSLDEESTADRSRPQTPAPAPAPAPAPPPPKYDDESSWDRDQTATGAVHPVEDDFGEFGKKPAWPKWLLGIGGVATAALALFVCGSLGAGGMFVASTGDNTPATATAPATPPATAKATPAPAEPEAPIRPVADDTEAVAKVDRGATTPRPSAPAAAAAPPPAPSTARTAPTPTRAAAAPAPAPTRPAPSTARTAPPPPPAPTPPPVAARTAPPPPPKPVAVATRTYDLAPPPITATDPIDIPEVTGTSDLSSYRERGYRGQLDDADRFALESVPRTSGDYTQARVYLYQDAKARGDWGSRSGHLDALMAIPENQYNPSLLAEQGEMAIARKDYGTALVRANLAERHWARLPSDLVFTRKAMIFEIQAAAWQGIFYQSEGDDKHALSAAIRSWERYQKHVSSRSRSDLVAKADAQLAKLYDAERRLE